MCHPARQLRRLGLWTPKQENIKLGSPVAEKNGGPGFAQEMQYELFTRASPALLLASVGSTDLLVEFSSQLG